MEESEKRRERLKAMRKGAAQAEVCNKVENSSTPGLLSNPLIEPSEGSLVQNEVFTAPRFDFYTDPMSAFSGNRRKELPHDQFTSSRLRNAQMTDSPTHQFQTNFSPNQTSYHAQGPHHTPSAHMTPPRMDNPFPMHQGTPGVWNRSAGMTSYNFPPSSSRGGNISSPNFGRVSRPGLSSGQGRGLMGNSPSTGSGWVGSPSSGRGSPSPNSGRGRGHWFGNSTSPSFGQGGQRGRGPRAHVTAEDNPELFYDKSMIEDPWKFLTPVIWSSHTPDSWLPKSVSMKKARVVETHSESSSQPSLAEYLAASLNEAVNDASDA